MESETEYGEEKISDYLTQGKLLKHGAAEKRCQQETAK